MTKRLQFALIADTYPPLRTSGAVQLRDLSREFVRQGYDITVILPEAYLDTPWHIEQSNNVRVLRLKSPRTKDINYVWRTINEFFMPFIMRYSLRSCPLSKEKWDGIIWYSPSIFHGPFVQSLKSVNSCKSYLIIRDIFPDWAVDMGLMGRSFPYLLFKSIARYQYSVADIIGVQTPGNRSYFAKWLQKSGRRLEVLQNWLDSPATKKGNIYIDQTPLSGRKIFVYAGNMGVAQGMDILIDLAEKMCSREDMGFLFVGRGSETQRLKESVEARGLKNLLFFDEVDPDTIPHLYSQCHVGIVALDSRHKSHNIPGKFLTYLQSGLPVLANLNPGNDLASIIRKERVGQACESGDVQELVELSNQIIEQLNTDPNIAERCRNLFAQRFSVEHSVRQIVNSLLTEEK